MTRGIHFVSYLRRELTVVAGISLEKEAAMLCSWRSINGDDNGQAALAKAQRGAVGDGQSSLADVAAWDGTDDAAWDGRRQSEDRDGAEEGDGGGRVGEGRCCEAHGGEGSRLPRSRRRGPAPREGEHAGEHGIGKRRSRWASR